MHVQALPCARPCHTALACAPGSGGRSPPARCCEVAQGNAPVEQGVEGARPGLLGGLGAAGPFVLGASL